MAITAVGAIWRADRGGHSGVTKLVVAVVMLVVVMCGRLTEEGLHASMAAVVKHDDLDDLLTLDKCLGPQVSHADSGLVVLLEGEMMGGGACR